MTYNLQHFVDPTIPGLSGRDLTARAAPRIRIPSVRRKLGSGRALVRIARHLLRDIGIDRDAF